MQTVIRDIAALNYCLLMLISLDLMTECCSH